MQKIVLIVIGVITVIIIGFFIFKNDPVITNYPAYDRTGVILFGDSLATGTGSTEGNDLASLLSDKLGEPVLNFGVPGDTSQEGLNRVDEVISKNPRVVLVLLGGNDFLRRFSKDQTFSNIDTIVKKLHESGSIVVLLGVKSGILTDSHEEEFEDIAKNRGALYVRNILDGIFNEPKYMSDSIHPNDAGYKKIVEKIHPVLMRVF